MIESCTGRVDEFGVRIFGVCKCICVKFLGGSTSLNAMAYVRGHPYDYDRWEKEGAKNWSFK